MLTINNIFDHEQLSSLFNNNNGFNLIQIKVSIDRRYIFKARTQWKILFFSVIKNKVILNIDKIGSKCLNDNKILININIGDMFIFRISVIDDNLTSMFSPNDIRTFG
jgi:hypothetical protein